MLKSFISDVPPAGYDQENGYGRIDANWALTKTKLPYRIRHFQHTVNTSGDTLIASNQTIQFPEGIDGLASGYYIGTSDIYRLIVTLNHGIPQSETYLSGWVRNSGCDLYGYTSTILNPHWSEVTLNSSNKTSATLTGYIYKTKITNILGQTVGYRWFPTNLNSSVKFSYSIYTIDDDPSIGIAKQYMLQELNIFPNPANDQLNVEYTLNEYNDVLILIYDYTGKFLQAEKFNGCVSGLNIATLNISNLEKGLYICKINFGNVLISRRFIKI